MKTAKLLIQLARPHFLLGGILLYALGAGVARYLGASINWDTYLAGQIWGTMIQLSTHFFNEYFDSTADAENPNRTLFTGGSGVLGPGKLPRAVAIWGGIISLAVAASLTVILLVIAHPAPVTVLFMALIFLGAFFYSVPPIQLESTGYGELVASILVSFLVPTFAFLLQRDELPRLLPMIAFPLVALNLAMLLAFDLPDYFTDIKFDKRNLLVRLGWQLGMNLHNLLILAAYLLLGAAILLGLPARIGLPAFLSLPLGLLQIWQMVRIANGAKPNWNLLTLGAIGLYAFTAYLLTFSFWIH